MCHGLCEMEHSLNLSPFLISSIFLVDKIVVNQLQKMIARILFSSRRATNLQSSMHSWHHCRKLWSSPSNKMQPWNVNSFWKTIEIFHAVRDSVCPFDLNLCSRWQTSRLLVEIRSQTTAGGDVFILSSPLQVQLYREDWWRWYYTSILPMHKMLYMCAKCSKRLLLPMHKMVVFPLLNPCFNVFKAIKCHFCALKY